MFTGIVEELGEVVAIEQLNDEAVRLTVRGTLATSDAKIGDSIAVNGVCLTAVELTADTFAADVMAETLRRTTTGALTVGSQVNLERPVTLATRLGGHVVQGHVDGVGRVIDRQPSENWEVVTIEIPIELAKYLVEKGSVTVDGTSLTVASVTNSTFTVSLIPETLRKTTLGQRPVGSLVNLEVDVLAKYVERLIEATK
jgi:riboflavin synthase